MAAAVPAWPRWHQPKWRPTRSLESITMGDKQASRQSFSPSDWRLIGGRQLLGKSRRELTLLVHFFWVPSSFPSPFFACKKTEHLVWLIAAANRQRLDLSLFFSTLCQCQAAQAGTTVLSSSKSHQSSDQLTGTDTMGPSDAIERKEKKNTR